MTTLLNSELNRLQKSIKSQQRLFLFLIIMSFAASFATYKLGIIDQEKATIERATKLIDSKKKCFTVQDIEVVTLGEIQE